MLCGITRELVYFAFTELRLKLPVGFDTAGIPQYSPEFLQSLFDSQKPVQTPGSISSALHIEPQQAQRTEQVDVPSCSTSTPPTVPVSDSPSLLDIEQQRRRELLARKAVIASRKGKQPQTSALDTPSPRSTGASSVNTPFKDIEMTSAEVTPAATVDDFLNSIGPSEPTTVHEPPLPVKSESESDGMDIDEIPGLGGIWVSEEFDPPSAEPTPTLVPIEPPSSATLPPDPPNSTTTPTGPLSSGESTPSHPGDSIASQRLGTKRPVAADFVDAEKSQSPTYHPSFPNGQPPTHTPYTRRRPGGFASITSARRCVIDLSDSEDEDYSEGAPPQQRSLLPSRHVSFHSHFAASPSFTTMNTPPSAGVSSLSGVTLLEKELEIKRMREMIAQKEQMRLRKLVSMPPQYIYIILTRGDRFLRGIRLYKVQCRTFPTLLPPSWPLLHPRSRRKTPPLALPTTS